jgi:hypothetical protein
VNVPVCVHLQGWEGTGLGVQVQQSKDLVCEAAAGITRYVLGMCFLSLLVAV